MLELRRFLARKEFEPELVPQVVVGDLNVYADFAHPLQLLTMRQVPPSNACLQTIRRTLEALNRRHLTGTVVLRSMRTNLPLGTNSHLVDGSFAPDVRTVPRNRVFVSSAEQVASTASRWRLAQANVHNQSAAPLYTLTRVADGALLAATDEGRLRAAERGAVPTAWTQWSVERFDLGTLESAAAAFVREPSQRLALVLFDWEARVDTEQTALEGDVLLVLNETTTQWWLTRRSDGHIGFMPINHIEPIDALPVCPKTMSAQACTKNIHLVRLRSTFNTVVHWRHSVVNASGADSATRTVSMQLLADPVEAGDSVLFQMTCVLRWVVSFCCERCACVGIGRSCL
jgi:hypothetical protein